MLDVIIPILVVVLVVVILSITSKNKDKVDKGFKFNYYSLSYRRRMIRTLISLPIIVLSSSDRRLPSSRNVKGKAQ
jgi:hypothetical protein